MALVLCKYVFNVYVICKQQNHNTKYIYFQIKFDLGTYTMKTIIFN